MVDKRAILEVATETGDSLAELQRLKDAFDQAISAMAEEAGKIDFDPGSESAIRLREEVNRTGRELAVFTNEAAGGIGEVDEATGKLNDALQRFGKFSAEGLRDLALFGAGVVSAFATQALKTFVIDAVKVNQELQSIRGTLTEVTGSQAAANREIAFGSEVADRLGIDVKETLEIYADFSRELDKAGASGKEAQSIFEGVAEGVRATGGGVAETEKALKVFVDLLGDTDIKGAAVEKRLNDALPGAFRALASSIQKEDESIESATKRLEKLIDTSDNALQSIPGLANALTGAFSGEALDQAISSTEAGIVRIQNEIFNLQTSFAAGFSDQINEGINETVAALEGLEPAATLAGSGVAFLSSNLIRIASVFTQIQLARANAAAGFLGLFDESEADKARALLANVVFDVAAVGRQADVTTAELGSAAGKIIGEFGRISQAGVEIDDVMRMNVGEAVVALIQKFEEAGQTAPPALLKILEALGLLADEADRAVENVSGLSDAASKEFTGAAEAAEKLRSKSIALAEAFAAAKEGGDNLQLKLIAEEAERLAKQFEALDQTVPSALQAIRSGSEDATESAAALRKQLEGVNEAISKANKAQQSAGRQGRQSGTGKQADSVAELQGRYDELTNQVFLTADELNELDGLQGRIADATQESADAARAAGDQIFFQGQNTQILNDVARGLIPTLDRQNTALALGEERFAAANQAVRENYEGIIRLGEQSEDLSGSLASQGEALDSTITRYDDAATIAAKTEQAIAALKQQTIDQTEAFRNLGPATEEATTGSDKLAESSKKIKEEAKQAQEAVKKLKDEIVSLSQANIDEVQKGLAEVKSVSQEILELWQQIKACIEQAA